MKSLLEYADFLQDNSLKHGDYPTHLELLDEAAYRILQGFNSAEEAEEYNLTFFDPYGLEIEPEVVYLAVRYLEETPERRNEVYRKSLKF